MPEPLPAWASTDDEDEPPPAPVVVALPVPVDLQGTQNTGTLAQSLAELIEAQIGAARESSADDLEKLAALERRIGQLEDELRSNRAAFAELGLHLQAIAGVLGKL
jgi:hypothetical protein